MIYQRAGAAARACQPIRHAGRKDVIRERRQRAATIFEQARVGLFPSKRYTLAGRL